MPQPSGRFVELSRDRGCARDVWGRMVSRMTGVGSTVRKTNDFNTRPTVRRSAPWILAGTTTKWQPPAGSRVVWARPEKLGEME